MLIHRIRIVAFILLVLTIIWVVFMGISTANIEPGWGALEYVKWASEKGVAYMINYLNVSLLTLAVITLFTLLYSYLKKDAEQAALTGLILVPVYGIMNLVCYSMQISVVPDLAEKALEEPGSLLLVSQLVQANPQSIAGYINGLAYAILGIPSIVYGWLLVRSHMRLSGYLLMVNGILCILGIIGYMLDNHLLSSGIMAGGIAFLFSLLAMVIEFRERIDCVELAGSVRPMSS